MILLMIQDDQQVDGRHLEDGELIRLLDGECDSAEERRFRPHLEACSVCQRNADTLRRLSQQFSTAVVELEEPTPPARAKPPWRAMRPRLRRSLLSGAGVLAVVASLFAVTPVRAWMAERWEAIRTLILGSEADDQQGQQASSVVSFVPTGASFLIDFTGTQSRGTLSLTVDSVASASARIVGGGGNDEIVVLREGLRIRNSAESSASYELRLPRYLESVEVRVAGEVVVRYDLTVMTRPARWQVDLAKPWGTER